MSTLYRKRPVLVNAIQYNHPFDLDKVIAFLHTMATIYRKDCKFSARKEGLFIITLEGEMHVSEGDYIICGVQGEYYPCKPDIFEATYDKAEA